MKYKHIFWGLLLITTGTLSILRTMEVICFSWWSVLSFWPLILVWIGIKLLPVKEGWKALFALLVLALAVLLLLTGVADNSCRLLWKNVLPCW
jgi:hypothetical protein